MPSISLITFDLFGTLLDWQTYVDQAFPGQYGNFLEMSGGRQLPGSAIFPYRDLLYDVAMDLAPRSSREVLSFFADGLGFARPFTDSRALQSLGRMAMLGCVSNSDFRHLVDVQKTLGTVFDVAVLAEELRAYKPHPDAWDAIVDTVTRKLGFERSQWLHVSAFADFDLVPAKERGLRTCYMPRPGGTKANDVLRAGFDYNVSDLWQLCSIIQEVNGTPVRYSVRAKARTPEIAADYGHWLQHVHGPEMLQTRCCQQFQLLRENDTTYVCDYVFTNKAGLAEYHDGAAVKLREKTRARFGEDDILFERSEAELLSGYGQRNRYDFLPR